MSVAARARSPKTGNTHARRLLVETAWHQRRPLRASTALERRRQGQPAVVRARADKAAAGYTHAGTRSRVAASGARSSRSRSHASSPATAGHSRPCRPHPQRPDEESAPAKDARSDPRDSYEQPARATLDSRERPPLLTSHTRSCGPDPRISAVTLASTTAGALSPPNEEDPQIAGLQCCHLTDLTPYQLSCLHTL